eukprot:gene12238-biopygen7558
MSVWSRVSLVLGCKSVRKFGGKDGHGVKDLGFNEGPEARGGCLDMPALGRDTKVMKPFATRIGAKGDEAHLEFWTVPGAVQLTPGLLLLLQRKYDGNIKEV